MNKYLKSFLLRGLIFGGFGPIILGIIYATISINVNNFSLTAIEVLVGIISVYMLAFIQAGCSVFNQIEEWPITKSLFCHFSCIYVAYVTCYLINTWIPFEPMVLLVFTVIFVSLYFIIWFTVYFIVKLTSKKMNSRLS